MGTLTYQVHGLTVLSDVQLPASQIRDPAAPDVEVRRTCEPWPSPGRDWTVLAKRDEPFRFRIWRATDQLFVEFGQFRCRTDATCRRIWIQSPCPLPSELESLLVLGVPLTIAAMLRDRFVVHASSAALDGAAVVILGRPGAGKSTLASVLCASGWGLLADDALALGRSPDGWIAHPAAAELRMRPHAAATAELFGNEVRRSFDERLVFAPRASGPARVSLLLFPSIGNASHEVRVVPISRRDVVVELLRNTRIGSWTDSAILRDLTHQAATLARTTRGLVVQLPRLDLMTPEFRRRMNGIVSEATCVRS